MIACNVQIRSDGLQCLDEDVIFVAKYTNSHSVCAVSSSARDYRSQGNGIIIIAGPSRLTIIIVVVPSYAHRRMDRS